MSQGRGKSDAGAVPEKLPNQASGEIPAAAAVVEEVEGRPAAKGNAVAARMSRTTIQVYYEQDFLGFSDGFRPGKSAHNALDAVAVDVWTKQVGWILDADIAKFFDTIEHDRLTQFIEHRVAFARVVRLMKKWLHAGVLEDGRITQSGLGAAQGGSVSPLLGNIFLHYAFNPQVKQWRLATPEATLSR